jgi:nicotinate dehydrogenase subunit B
MLSDARLVSVLKAAADHHNWDTRHWDMRPSPTSAISRTGVVTGRGVSCVLYEGNNGYSAMVAEVQVEQSTGVITVTRLIASQDAGPISNPDGIRDQMEGGALQGMSRALNEQVNWNSTNGALTSVDWRSYPVFRWGDPLPVVKTVLLNQRSVPQMGVGECTITIVAPAIANAVFDATGAASARFGSHRITS